MYEKGAFFLVKNNLMLWSCYILMLLHHHFYVQHYVRNLDQLGKRSKEVNQLIKQEPQ